MILSGTLHKQKQKAEAELPLAAHSERRFVEIMVMDEPRIHHVDDICDPKRCPLAKTGPRYRAFVFEKVRGGIGGSAGFGGPYYWKLVEVS